MSAISYLLNPLDPKTCTRQVAPQDVNLYPYAPWWHDEAGSLAATFDDYKFIPRVGILAVLHHYPNLLPEKWLNKLIKSTISDILEMGMDSPKR